MSKLPRFNDLNYIHFITTRTYKSISYFKNKNNCLILLNVINKLKGKLKFKLLGYVIMPDHFHCLILLNLNAKYNISYLIMRIKGYSARLINKSLYLPAEAKPSASHFGLNNHPNRLGEGSASPVDSALPNENILPNHIWQKSFYDFPIYSDKKLEEKLTYIHNNPLKANLTSNPRDYLWSSYQNYYLENNLLIKIDYLDG